MQEEWKHYIRYARNQFGAAWIETDLEISNYGRIKDGGIFRYKKFTNEMIHVNVNGHRCIGSGHSNYCIYHLVYELFVEPIPKGYVVHHKDHNKHNDRVDNLEMMTKAEHNSIHHKDKIPWNKGLTKDTDERVAKYALSKIKKNNVDSKHNCSENLSSSSRLHPLF